MAKQSTTPFAPARALPPLFQIPEFSTFFAELSQHAALADILTMARHYHQPDLVHDGWAILARSLATLSDTTEERLNMAIDEFANAPTIGGAR